MPSTFRSSVWFVVLLAGCGRISFDVEADSAATDSVSGFCGTVPPGYALCTDFDSAPTIDPVALGFAYIESANVGTVSTTNVAESAPNALASLIGTQTGLSYACASYNAVNPSYIELRSSLYLPQRPTASYEINSLNVTMTAAGSFYNDLDINPSGNDAYRQEWQDASMMGHGMASPIPAMSTGTWHHVIQKLDIANQTFEVSIDGTVVATGPTLYPIIAGATRFQVGANYVLGPISGAGLYIDNVVLYVR